MEIYLTKMILNSTSRRVWKDLSNLQNLHRTVREHFRRLETPTRFRITKEKRRAANSICCTASISTAGSGKAVLFVQSGIKPDWSFLQDDYAVQIDCKTVHEQYSNIENGMRLLFRLQANPTKRVDKSDEKADGRFKPSDKREIRRRVELRTDEEKIGWLRRKGEDAGFRLTDVRIKNAVENAVAHSSSKQFGRRGAGDKKMTFGAVVFEGVLQVTDAEKFLQKIIPDLETALNVKTDDAEIEYDFDDAAPGDLWNGGDSSVGGGVNWAETNEEEE